jgi:hypothetical protein
MSGSINNFCPTVSGSAPGSTPPVTLGQQDLATICSAMIGNALQLQGQPVPAGLGSYGLSTSGLQGALQNLNGGAELLVPTSQASVAQTTRQTETIENRLKELRGAAGGAMTASGTAPREQLASLSASGLDGQLLSRKTKLCHFPIRSAGWVCSPTGSVSLAAGTSRRARTGTRSTTPASSPGPIIS